MSDHPSESARDSNRRERAEHLFDEVRSLDPAERASRIAQACTGDQALKEELESLLVHADAAEQFFDLLGRAVTSPDITGSLIAGRYEIRACIGVGGMGEVYRARDNLLERDVALKFLTSFPATGTEAQRTLLKEARAAAALEHANVCTVHEIGETADGRHFISMAYYDGETLKEHLLGGPLPVPEAVDVARQIARGLGAAHARGIVHSDVKPGNVMLLRNGTVKLLDFGLARSTDVSLTSAFATPGTVAYMSPEQVRGDAVDARSDLFSLGVVLYEMLAGTNPFRRGADQAVLQAILHDEPIPLQERRPGLPGLLAGIVTRLLRKRAGDRYEDADAVIADLDRMFGSPARTVASWPNVVRTIRSPVFATLALVVVAATGGALWLSRSDPFSSSGTAAALPPPASEVADRKTIAVLPFTNVNRDAEQDYLVDGITEELIGTLSRVRSLRVVARASAFTFKNATRDIREIGRALNAGTIVDGSVQRVGELIRVRAQLINVADGLNLWSETYDYELEDILALQRDLALRIAAVLETELTADDRERLGRRLTANPEAYADYLRGRHFWNQRTPAAFTKAIEYYMRAIDADSRFAAAYAGLALVYSLQGIWSELPPAEAKARMRAAALRAIELDDNSAEAHSALGVFQHVYEWNSAAAEAEQLRAIELDPGYVSARFFYGNLLRSNGRVEEAMAQYRVAAVLDPLDANISEAIGNALLLTGRTEQAYELARHTFELDSMYWRANTVLGEYHELTANLPEALRLYERALALQGGSIERSRIDYPRVLARLGREAEARAALSEIQAQARRTGPHDPIVATLFLALDDAEGALAWLEQSYRERHPLIRFIGGLPLFMPFEKDPRYMDLLRRVGLRR